MELILEPKGFLMNKITDIPVGISQSSSTGLGQRVKPANTTPQKLRGPLCKEKVWNPNNLDQGTSLGVSPTCPSTALSKSLSLLFRFSLALCNCYDSHIKYSADSCLWIASVSAREPCRNLAEPLREEAQREEEDLWGPCGLWLGPVFCPNHACLLCCYVSKQSPYTPAIPELLSIASPHYGRSNFFSL